MTLESRAQRKLQYLLDAPLASCWCFTSDTRSPLTTMLSAAPAEPSTSAVRNSSPRPAFICLSIRVVGRGAYCMSMVSSEFVRLATAEPSRLETAATRFSGYDELYSTVKLNRLSDS